MEEFDVVVIGAGPGGYVAAIRAAELGLKTACVDAGRNKKGDGPALGGTCLNVGCIPSKALLQSSEHYHHIKEGLAEHGISAGSPKIDVAKMIERKDGIVTKLTGGIAFLFKKNKVTSHFGKAAFKSKEADGYVLEVTPADGSAPVSIKAKNVIVATGSVPRELPGCPVDNVTVLDNKGALDLGKIPKKLGMIGSGVIGLEMGSVWRRLGSEVTVLEAMPTFLAAADQQVAKEAFKAFTKEQGIDIQLGAKVEKVENLGAKGAKVTWEHAGEKRTETFDKLIVCIGRRAFADGLGAEAVGLKLDEAGRVVVDEFCQTNLPGVWAIGDAVRGPMLAHKASIEGSAVAERIAGQRPMVDLDVVPGVVYTDPEIAWVGKTEEQLKAEGVAYKKGVSNFAANGRALGMGQGRGFVKVLVCEKTDRILGVHMIGPMVSELISEAVVAMEFSASGEDLARIIHAHPTLSEALHEAAKISSL